jgi:hypothetical protein
MFIDYWFEDMRQLRRSEMFLTISNAKDLSLPRGFPKFP